MKEYKDEKGIYHREDGPAFELVNGTKFWFFHGNRHREDGPAEEWTNGRKGWYWEDEFIMGTEGSVTESQVKEFRLRRMI